LAGYDYPEHRMQNKYLSFELHEAKTGQFCDSFKGSRPVGREGVKKGVPDFSTSATAGVKLRQLTT